MAKEEEGSAKPAKPAKEKVAGKGRDKKKAEPTGPASKAQMAATRSQFIMVGWVVFWATPPHPTIYMPTGSAMGYFPGSAHIQPRRLK